MTCLNCGKPLESSGTKPKKYCNDSCKMAIYRKNRNEDLEKSNAEEEKLRKVVIEGETSNCRSAREYREFQKEWIEGACEEYEPHQHDLGIKCKRCNKPYLRHHEARYVVQHGELL